MQPSRVPHLARRLRNVVLAALAVRAAYVALVWTPYFRPQYEGTYLRATMNAYALAAGLGYSHYLNGSPADADLNALRNRADSWEPLTPADGGQVSRDGLRPELLYPPGWPIVGAALHRATGAPVWLCMQVFGAACGTLAVVFVYLVILRVTESNRLACGSAWAFALFPPLAYGAVSLYAMSAVPLLALCSTWLILRGVRSAGWKRFGHYAGAGVFAGIAAYFRADYILLGPALGLALWPSGLGLRHALAATAVIATAAFGLLTPWALRNNSLGAGWTFTSCGTGGVLVTGLAAYPNNPWQFRPHDEGRYADARDQGFDDPWGPAADVYFRRRFREAVLEHPDAALQIIGLRTLEGLAAPHDWGLKPMGEDVRGSEIRKSGAILNRLDTIVTSLWPRIVSALVVMVGNIGCLVAFVRERRRRPLVHLILVAPAYALLVHVFSHMMPDFLLPGLYGQLFGLIYLLLRGWREPQGLASRSVETAPVAA